MREQWRTIPGHTGYQASDRGRIRSIDRVVLARFPDKKIPRRWRGCLLKPTSGAHGRQQVSLERGEQHLVHRLVLLAFVGEPPLGRQAAHWDGNPANNRLANLRWATWLENHTDKIRHGHTIRGARHPMVRLTQDDILAIRASDAPHRVLAEGYGVSKRHIGRIKTGLRWGWL